MILILSFAPKDILVILTLSFDPKGILMILTVSFDPKSILMILTLSFDPKGILMIWIDHQQTFGVKAEGHVNLKSVKICHKARNAKFSFIFDGRCSYWVQ